MEEGNMGLSAIADDEDAEANDGGEANTTGNSMSSDEDGDAEPHVGMEFDSEDAVKNFYSEYARRVGFSIRFRQYSRSRSDGAVTFREYLCAKDGLRRRAGDSCGAMLRIELNGKDKWIVTKFVKEHSHDIVSPSKVHHLRPRRHFAGAAKNMAETYEEGVGVVPSGVMYVSTDGNRVSPAEANRGARSAPPPVESNRAAAVALVFPEARHCFNKWDMLREGPERLAHACYSHPNFQVDLYNCINSTDTIEEFESSWDSILDKYDLRRNDWLQSLYNARAKWVPAYFRDSFFAAISPNQGFQSSFFEGYVNQQTTLPMFFRQYERALESSFEKAIEADFDTMCTTPVLRTPSPMEKQAANLYTRKIFAKFQDELVETFVYTANRIDDDGSISTFRVAKFEDDSKAYIVTLNGPEMRASCSCQMFEYSGILCRHILTVFTVTNVLTLPSHYIMKRWTRNAKNGFGSDNHFEPQGQESLAFRYNHLCKEAINYAEEAAIAPETFNVAMVALREGGKKVAAAKKNVAKVAPPSSKGSGIGYDDRRNSTSAPDMVPLLWPRQDEITRRFNLNDANVPAQHVSDLNLPRMAPVSVHSDDGHPDNMVVLPCLKSMTWVMENKTLAPANRVAVINLKLQDYSRTSSGESEIKFQLSRVTLEPMLRSMAYISEQLSTPANKVAVINLKLQDTETTSGESEVKFQVSRDTLGAMLRSMAYIREQLSNAAETHSESPSKKQRK
ncbi:hypothetical protein RHGRI_037872 [Rhododendron griersonianum]|uniref:Protein FAR1-RELATED SEQUENCE n=1 Tax=Rhododendron griersonianum TaxID=479676 RepID=A0AAV6HWY0_9ERIC|nr:hypothetical protein RHGRI_037872 [Rhododendron griersonianum]